MKQEITVHMLIKNEENFVKSSILSVIDIAKEIIIFDTGSTDSTIKRIKEINSKKIKLFEKGNKNPKELVEMRNEMIKLTKTEWFFIVDGDEIVYYKDQNNLLQILNKIPRNVFRLEVTIRDFIKDANIVARDRLSGKIWRTNMIKFFGKYPFEYGAPKNNITTNLKDFSSNALKDEIICYHMSFFPRSSEDYKVKIGRHWRKIPFYLKPFFGPYPKYFEIKSNYLLLIPKLIFYNIVGFFHIFFHKKEQNKDAKGNYKQN